jgi:hypothetical protein
MNINALEREKKRLIFIFSMPFDEEDKDFESNAKCNFRLGDRITGFFRYKFKPLSSNFRKNESLKIRELDLIF